MRRALPAAVDPTWQAIAGCMRLLEAERPEARRRLARDLGELATHSFDFAPRPIEGGPARREALGRLYREAFMPIFEPAVVRLVESPRACAARVEAALRGEPNRREP